MALKTMLVAVLVLFVTLSSVNSQNGCQTYPPCGEVPNNMQYIYPDFTDCNKYWVCQNGGATRLSCPAGQELDLVSFDCQMPSTDPNLFRVTCSTLFTGLPTLQG